MIWRHRHSRFSLSHLWVRSATEFKHSFLQTQPLLRSRTCHRSSLPPKRLKILNVSIPLSCHSSVRTHHKGTLLWKLTILIYLQDQYLSTTSNVELLPTESPSIKILFKFDLWIGLRTRITAVGDRGFTNTL